MHQLTHIIVDGLVDSGDVVGVMYSKFWVVGYLDVFVDNAIDYAKTAKVEGFARDCTIGNELILLIEVVEERRTIVTPVAFREQVELRRLDFGVELGKGTVETLQDVPCGYCRHLRGVGCQGIDDGVASVHASE